MPARGAVPGLALGTLIAVSLAMEIRLIQTLEAFDALETDWQSLQRQFKQTSPYLNFAWQRAAYTHYGKANAELATLVAVDGALVKAILPMMRRRSGSLVRRRTLELIAPAALGMTDIGAIGDKAHFAKLWHFALTQTAQSLAWDEMVLSGQSREQLAQLPLSTATGTWRSSNQCPVLTLPANYDEFFAALSANKRKELRRHERDLAAAGKLEFHVKTTAEEIEESFPELVRLNSARAATSKISNTLASAPFGPCQLNIASNLARQDGVRLFFLSVAEKPIAALLAYRNADCYWLYAGGHAPEWDRFGPGTTLDAWVVRYALQHDATRLINFGPGPNAYKLRYKPLLEPIWEYRQTGSTLVGNALIAWRSLRAKMPSGRDAPAAEATA